MPTEGSRPPEQPYCGRQSTLWEASKHINDREQTSCHKKIVCNICKYEIKSLPLRLNEQKTVHNRNQPCHCAHNDSSGSASSPSRRDDVLGVVRMLRQRGSGQPAGGQQHRPHAPLPVGRQCEDGPDGAGRQPASWVLRIRHPHGLRSRMSTTCRHQLPSPTISFL